MKEVREGEPQAGALVVEGCPQEPPPWRWFVEVSVQVQAGGRILAV